MRSSRPSGTRWHSSGRRSTCRSCSQRPPTRRRPGAEARGVLGPEPSGRLDAPLGVRDEAARFHPVRIRHPSTGVTPQGPMWRRCAVCPRWCTQPTVSGPGRRSSGPRRSRTRSADMGSPGASPPHAFCAWWRRCRSWRRIPTRSGAADTSSLPQSGARGVSFRDGSDRSTGPVVHPGCESPEPGTVRRYPRDRAVE
jgi:hypothetical protein